jgi:CheY-like chemotaxis protein
MIDSFVKVVGAIAALISSFAWPLVAVWLIWKFSPVIRDFLANISEGSLKGFGIEATAKRNAAVEILKADLAKSDGDKPAETNLQLIKRAEHSIRSADALTDVLPIRELKGRSILWVDDDPDETYYERRAFTELGLDLDIETNAQEALVATSKRRYDVAVIVPAHIVPSPDGDLLIDTLRLAGTPFIIYASKHDDEKELSHRVDGAFGLVSEVTSLILYVSSAVRGLRTSDFMQDYTYYYSQVRDVLKRGGK